MADPLSDIYAAFDRPFRELTDELTRRYPEARFCVRSNPIGNATAHQGHMLYVECFWPGQCPDETDHVILEVQLCHLATAPRVNADVCWGNGRVEAEFAPSWVSNDDWPEATPAVLGQLIAQMPELTDAFRQAVHQAFSEPKR